jgi:hypothetical protein
MNTGITMKKLTTIITSLLFTLVSLQSNAALINLSSAQASYEVGDTVLLDITVQDLSLDTAEIGFDLSFDSLALTFDSFSFSSDVFDSALFSAADLSFFDNNIVEFFVLWWDSSDLPATSFSLGQASFTAQQAYNPAFTITDAYLSDVAGKDIDYPTFTSSVPVPEPSASLIMLLGLLILPLHKKLFATQK